MPAVVLAAGVAVAAVGTARAGSSRWHLGAQGILAVPAADSLFTEGWGAGLGVGGRLRVQITSSFAASVQADFVQFQFNGLEGVSNLGGERRFLHLGVPITLRVWQRRSPGDESLEIEAGAGWIHQSIAGTFGGDITGTGDASDDGLAVRAALTFSRRLYRTTRWSVGLSWSRYDLADATPQVVGLVLGLRMPVDGSRQRGGATPAP